MVDPALGRLRKLINARSDGVALQAVKDVLDRTGYKLPERLETDNAVTIRVEYEVIETTPIQTIEHEPITIALEQTNGSYTNDATQKHSD